MNTALVSDLSDAEPICPTLNLLLKPFARVSICVTLPQMKITGQAISNWEVIERLKGMCIPHQFTLLRVAKSTIEFVRFEGEVENRSLVPTFISMLDGKHVKLSGFAEVLKVTCGEGKAAFPSRHDWDSFFRDSEEHDETQPGERPDTVHISNIPCKFFIPRPSGLTNFQTFTYGSRLNFDVFIQFKEYIGFAKCMDAFRGKKLIMKETDEKAVAATIKVDFDRTKHLSAKSIAYRLQEKRKIEKLQQEREKQKNREKRQEEKKKMAEKMREIQKVKDQDERRRKREEKRRNKQEENRAQAEATKLTRRIAFEERKLMIAQRKLESIRLMCALLDRVKAVAEQQEESHLELEDNRDAEGCQLSERGEEKKGRGKKTKRKVGSKALV